MGIKQVKISTSDVAMGMFVSSLDRPWSQTPFPIQGLMVRDHQEIKSLKAYCDYVYIDLSKGRGPITARVGAVPSARISSSAGSLDELIRIPTRPKTVKTKPLVVNHNTYHPTASLKVESRKAEKVLLNLRGAFTLAVKQISKGKKFDYLELKSHVDEMVESVIRCPDAFTWLLRLRMKDQHSHDHGLRSSLWAVQFARYIGMSKSDISALCLGTLLKDIGKLKLSNELLRKKRRTPQEEKKYRQFVEYGVEMLRESSKVEPRVIAIVRYHCEHFDGSGFPEGASGDKIPFLARIAGIATTYDAVSNPRECSDPVAPSRAISLVYNKRGRDFQEDLVVEFIQSIGLYPTGTVVELTTGDIGVVMEQYTKSRLTPQVAILNAGSGQDSGSYTLVELKDENAARKALKNKGSKLAGSVSKLVIARDLEPSGYNIDLRQVSGMVMDCSYANVIENAGPSAGAFQFGKGLFTNLKQRFQRQSHYS